MSQKNELPNEGNFSGGGGVENGREGGGVGNGSEGVVVLKKGPWTAQEDAILIDYVTKHGEGNWNAVQKNTGLARCGKSCRLRWANHLRPNLKKGAFSPEEEKLIIELHAKFGNKWARMAALLPGRTDNEIKNYWNTRVKRRQRQGLPLYSNDVHSSQSNTSTTPNGTINPPANNPSFHFHNQNHYPLSSTPPLHSPLSSPHQHTSPYRPLPLFEPSSFSSSSTNSFTFQRPAPLLCTPLNFKRFRASGRYTPPISPPARFTPPISPTGMSYCSILDQNLPTQLAGNDSFQFPVTVCSSPIVQTRFESENLVSPGTVYSAKLELPSNQIVQTSLSDITIGTKVNEASNVQGNGGLLGDFLLESQALASGQTSRKRSYANLKEENNVLGAYRGLEDLSSFYWSSSSEPTKPKVEQADLSKTMQEDLSKLLDGIPPNMEVSDWFNDSREGSNGQSSGITTENNVVGMDMKPIMFPVANATDSNESHGPCPWDNLPEIF